MEERMRDERLRRLGQWDAGTSTDARRTLCKIMIDLATCVSASSEAVGLHIHARVSPPVLVCTAGCPRCPGRPFRSANLHDPSRPNHTLQSFVSAPFARANIDAIHNRRRQPCPLAIVFHVSSGSDASPLETTY